MLRFESLSALRRKPKMLQLLYKHAKDVLIPVNVHDEFHQTRKALLRHGFIRPGDTDCGVSAHKNQRPRITVLTPAGAAALEVIGTTKPAKPASGRS